MEEFHEELTTLCSNLQHRNYLEKVLKKLGPDFLAEKARKELIESNSKLDGSITQYFQQYIVMNAILKHNEETTLLNKKENICPQVIDPVSLNQVKKHFPEDDNCEGIRHFDLDQEYIDRFLKKNKMSKMQQEKFNENIQFHINEFCLKLMTFSGHKYVPGVPWKKSFSRIMRDLLTKLDLSKSSVENSKTKEVINMLFIYHKELEEGLEMLKQISMLYARRVEYESAVCKLFREKCRGLKLKIRLFELELLCKTYTQDTVAALKIISEQLDQQEEKLQEELTGSSNRLHAFQTLGPNFEKLVAEYESIANLISSQKFCMESFKAKMSESCSSIL